MHLGLGLFDAIVIIQRPKLGGPILAPGIRFAIVSVWIFSSIPSIWCGYHPTPDLVLHTKQQLMPKEQYISQSIPMQWMLDDAGCTWMHYVAIHSSLAAGRHQHSVLRKVHAWELLPPTTRSDSNTFSE